MGNCAKFFEKILLSRFLVDKFIENYAIMLALKAICFK